MTLKVTYCAVASLIPYARNARTHSDEQVAQLAGSIKEFGFTNPVLVDGERGIIAGHGRVLAAKRLGMAEVPTIELSHLSEAQRRAYVLADNKIALNAGWDNNLLKIELEDLYHLDFDMTITGFSLDEITNLIDPAAPPPLPDSAGSDSDNYVEQYGVIVICRDANHQERVFNELQEKGFEIKVVNT